MKRREIVAILMDERKESAVNVQKILTGWGCMIKTRLGIHDGVMDNCTQTGLIILEMMGEEAKLDEFCRKLNLISGCEAKRVTLQVD